MSLVYLFFVVSIKKFLILSSNIFCSQEKIHHLRADLIKLKEAYIKLEHHHSKRPEKYKKLADERKVRLERLESELASVRLQNQKLNDENGDLRKRLTVAQVRVFNF